MFGTVIERDEKDLRNGVVVVELCVGSQIRDDLFKAEFTMAESEVYFEPYYQVCMYCYSANSTSQVCFFQHGKYFNVQFWGIVLSSYKF